MEKNFLFMAFSTGKESVEAGVIKRYVGVAPVKVLAVNPSKAEQEKLYNTTIEKEPEYVGAVDVNGTSVKNVRISFVVKTDADKCDGIDVTTNVTFFVQNAVRVGSQSGKIQVIDKYGRTAWATKEEVDAKRIPQYTNGPANIDVDYRPAYVGEEELTNFIKSYLNIPSPQRYVDGKWINVDNLSDCEARLDHIADYFNGNFAELKEIVTLQPNNKVKVLFGVRTSEDGKEYQAVYTHMFLRNNVTNYSYLDKDVKDKKANGAYSTTTFEVCPLKEYTVAPTPVDDLPFPAPTPSNWFNN